jgi:hypothetical protein
MHIKDECGIIKKMGKLAKEQGEIEHGALVLGKIQKREDKIYYLIEDCMIENVGGLEQKGHIKIPAKVSYLFLQNCRLRKNIPVIIHTHPKVYWGEEKIKVAFSPPDMRFMEKFSKYAAKIGDISECLFIVTDSEDIQYCNWDLSIMNYTLEEDILEKND